MVIKVVKGNPTPEELAAALAVVQARAAVLASAPSGAPAVADEWAAPSRVARRHLPQPGPRAWGRTYWPA
ncbi:MULTISPECIES: acyl-CoA carboxylase epsilon subunit [unclassified Streptomyces]|uniref:acyl-CoA carboxylase epsilon subunit n=1 Tax=unclassified Streptomyces TaxID=2593676 RepID=UPI00225B8ABA|nr:MULTISPECIES: acyl-CoA carboxylase epsilon subunit [unclassified Streptomyces]MCX4527722.1 acyl-CoA carboxylase epsilon subunit [Streptomyces sp. NBC_01551]MCX4541680.1 acyl-CoA carboxylase epsilon subunit [Streptomyces sp. NBC_01565]